MKKFMLFAPLLLALVALGSCTKKATVITPQQNEVTFSILGGEIQVPVSADGAIDVQDNPEWLTVEVADSVLVFRAKPNDSGAVRSADVKLTGGDNVEAVIKVTQADQCTHITAMPDEVSIPKEGGSEEIKLETDGGNISVVPSEGINATYENGVIKVTAPANEGGTINGKLTIKCDTVETEVKVTIEGNICQRCSGKGKITCPSCGGKGWRATSGEPTVCLKCGGRYGELTQDDRNGSGRVTCPTCGGSGH